MTKIFSSRERQVPRDEAEQLVLTGDWRWGETKHTEAGSRHAEFGDQPGSNDWLDAGDLQQREELLANARLDVGAELTLLIHEQPNLLGNLAHCLFPNPIQLASSRSAVLAS